MEIERLCSIIQMKYNLDAGEREELKYTLLNEMKRKQ
jgi:hypothetical protein